MTDGCGERMDQKNVCYLFDKNVKPLSCQKVSFTVRLITFMVKDI
uniref:Uncharacterized protein n=1 Tax=Anguilla anguilla TaxID=7936 RepID=A0A0E9RE45_ANGAN